MSENEIDELGPIDYLGHRVPQAGKSSFTGEMADALATLVDDGVDPAPRPPRDPEG